MKHAQCHLDRKHYAKGLCQECYNRKWQEDHPGYSRQWDIKHRKTRNEISRRWRQKNRQHIREYKNKRRRENIQSRLRHTLRSRLNGIISNGQKVGSAVRDLGISIKAFMLYIENQFESGMSWDNYGEWHLDHIIPLASFDLTDRQQFLEAYNWLNYQPLWAKDNWSKGATQS